MADKPESNENAKPAEAKAEDGAQTDASAETQASAPEGGEEKAAASVALTDGLGGVLGVKAGMTQVFNDDGRMQAVTVIDLRPAVITQVKTKEKDGYEAVQLGFIEKKAKNMSKPETGHVKASGGKGFLHYQELRLPAGTDMSRFQPGQTISPEFVQAGEMVDVTATSKGKGFQGVMKRHNFGGAPRSHGVSIVHRMPGSIGNCADPAKVFKGKKMAGQMGNVRTTVQNLKVVRLDADKNVLLVHGSVPGPKSGVVTVRKAVKEFERKGAQQ